MEPVFIFFLILGGIFIFGGAVAYRRQKQLEKICTAVTTGTVVEMQATVSEDSDGHNRTYFHPVFRYFAGGQMLTKRSSLGTGTPRFSVGDSVEVRYDPDNPVQHYVVEDRSGNRAGKVFAVIGSAIAALALLLHCIL